MLSYQVVLGSVVFSAGFLCSAAIVWNLTHRAPSDSPPHASAVTSQGLEPEPVPPSAPAMADAARSAAAPAEPPAPAPPPPPEAGKAAPADDAAKPAPPEAVAPPEAGASAKQAPSERAAPPAEAAVVPPSKPAPAEPAAPARGAEAAAPPPAAPPAAPAEGNRGGAKAAPKPGANPSPLSPPKRKFRPGFLRAGRRGAAPLASPAMKLRIETDQGHLEWAPLDTPVVRLGRAEGCEVRLRERNVSRRHASLRRGPGGGWLLADHDSYNGSFLNGRRLVGEAPLSPRDLVQIGDYFLSLDAGAEPDVGATLAMPGGPASVPASTSHRLFAVEGASVALPDIDLGKGQLTIGSFDDCTVRIRGAALAGVRVRLRPLAGERYEILDESERSSMLVNGVELRRKVLETGDLVELGDSLMLGLDARLACSLRYAGGVRERHGAGPAGSAPWPMAARPAAGDGRKRERRPRVVR
ncbi:MAG TPA: FHA domain-containing protein, partial [Polyangiaceae bacterium]|nr:FHA domain-containing protein [Polyangiaceae bacterium]